MTEYKIKLIKDEGQEQPNGTIKMHIKKNHNIHYWFSESELERSIDGMNIYTLLMLSLEETAKIHKYPNKLEISLKVE